MNARTRRKRAILRARRHHSRYGWCWSCDRSIRARAAWAVTLAAMERYGSVTAFMEAIRDDVEELEPGVILVRKEAGPVGIGTPTGPAL